MSTTDQSVESTTVTGCLMPTQRIAMSKALQYLCSQLVCWRYWWHELCCHKGNTKRPHQLEKKVWVVHLQMRAAQHTADVCCCCIAAAVRLIQVCLQESFCKLNATSRVLHCTVSCGCGSSGAHAICDAASSCYLMGLSADAAEW